MSKLIKTNVYCNGSCDLTGRCYSKILLEVAAIPIHNDDGSYEVEVVSNNFHRCYCSSCGITYDPQWVKEKMEKQNNNDTQNS